MKKIHPEFFEVSARCFGCGTSFPTYSTQSQVTTELCSKCHPFFTGEHKYVDTAGRIEKFERKYKKSASSAKAK
jgi:large subunit ribosomal protein L31